MTEKTIDTVVGKVKVEAIPPLIDEDAPSQNLNRRTQWSNAELMAAEFPEPRWAVDGLLPEGLAVLAGRPKIGKSWLLMQIAVAVATGGMALGHKAQRGRVMYIALEDSPRRLQSRLKLMGAPADADIDWYTNYKTLSSGGLVDILNAVDARNYKLVAIDTLSRILGRADQMDPGLMTDFLGNLQHMAITKGMTAMASDHHRKVNGFDDDPVDDILGTTAKAAVVDAVFGLYRDRGKRTYTLRMTGRDIEEAALALQFDGELHCWQSLGNADEVLAEGRAADVMNAIRALNEDGELATNQTITDFINGDKGNTSKIIAELLANGKIAALPKKGRLQPYVLKQQ